jgi:NADPH2:quinone reductase
LGVHWGGYRSRRPEVLAEAHNALMHLWERNAIHPAPTTIAPLSDAPSLLATLTGGTTTGKLVLVP